MPKEIREIRCISSEDIEVRADGEGDEKQLFAVGRAIVYGKEVELWPGYFEKIRKGAFDKSIRDSTEKKSFFNHDPDMVLSTTRSNPKLKLNIRDDGVYYESPIPPTSYGNDLAENLKRKNVRGSSFAFSAPYPEGSITTRDEEGNYHREIVKGTVYELGPVTNPAYPQSKSGLRDAETAAKEVRQAYEKRENESTAKDIEKAENELELRKKQTYLLSLEGAYHD